MYAEPDCRNWRTLSTDRSVVVGVHTVAAAMRLKDVATLLDGDPRIGLTYTIVPDRFNDGVDDILRTWDVKLVPWSKATGNGASYDLAIGASLHRLGSLPAQRRFATPHGSGYSKRWPSWAWSGPEQNRPTYGLDRESLLDADNNPIVHGLNLSHYDQMLTLAGQCHEAVQAAVIGGDPAFDRLLLSQRFRGHYRAELNVREGQTLVAVTSTWGQASLLNRRPEVLHRLLQELPTTHRVFLTLHPAAWSEHGRGQIRAFLRDAIDAGLEVVDAGEDWRGLLVAADYLIGDHTSVSVYGAARGLPLLLSHFAEDEVDPDSVMAELAQHSPRLDDSKPLLDQLDAARLSRPMQQKVASERVSSVPGKSAELLRRTLYRLLDLDEPAYKPRLNRVSAPKLIANSRDRW